MAGLMAEGAMAVDLVALMAARGAAAMVVPGAAAARAKVPAGLVVRAMVVQPAGERMAACLAAGGMAMAGLVATAVAVRWGLARRVDCPSDCSRSADQRCRSDQCHKLRWHRPRRHSNHCCSLGRSSPRSGSRRLYCMSWDRTHRGILSKRLPGRFHLACVARSGARRRPQPRWTW